jgi:hypothetical protein
MKWVHSGVVPQIAVVVLVSVQHVLAHEELPAALEEYGMRGEREFVRIVADGERLTLRASR